MVKVINVFKRFGDNEVLKGINLEVLRGKILVIIGPSGSGKSTLLRAINHLETIDEGEIWIEDVQVTLPLKGRKFEKHMNSTGPGHGLPALQPFPPYDGHG